MASASVSVNPRSEPRGSDPIDRSCVLPALSLAIIMLATLAAVIDSFHTGNSTTKQINGPVDQIEPGAGPIVGDPGSPRFPCLDRQARAIVVERLKSAPFPIQIPPKRYKKQVTAGRHCGFRKDASDPELLSKRSGLDAG